MVNGARTVMQDPSQAIGTWLEPTYIYNLVYNNVWFRFSIDCTEFKCQSTKNYREQGNNWSDYKKNTSKKVAIMVSPTGMVIQEMKSILHFEELKYPTVRALHSLIFQNHRKRYITIHVFVPNGLNNFEYIQILFRSIFSRST